MLRALPACRRAPALPASLIIFTLPLLLILLSCLPVQTSQSGPGDLRALHAALKLTGDARESELQRVMPELKRSGCSFVLQAAALAQPPSHTVHMHAAFCSDGPSALAHFAGALALHPVNVQSMLVAAYHAAVLPHSARLVRCLARLVAAAARSSTQLYALAMHAAALGSFQLSSHYFSLAVGRGLPLGDVGDSWAMALADGGRPLRALQLLLAAGCCDAAAPAWCPASAVHVSEVLVVQGMGRLALQLLQCGTGDGDVLWLSCSARAQRSLGNLSAAAALFAHALQLQPNSTDARRNVGMILQEAGLLREAEEHLLVCVQQRPGDATALSTLATVYAKTGRAQQAEDMFLAAARLKPDDASIRSNVATFYRNSRLWAKAEAFASAALARDAEACDMHAQLLQVHAQQSHPLPALRASAAYVACCSAGAACPDIHSARLSDVFFRRQLCDWSMWQEDAQLLQRAAASAGFDSGSFSAIQASVFDVPPAVVRAFARRQAADIERLRPMLLHAIAQPAERGPGHVLRVAFSFSDWFDHPVGDDALAAVAAAAAPTPQPVRAHVFCISPSVPLRSQPVNSSHPCLQPTVHAHFLADNSTQVRPSLF
jgi:tetratricopeptide (TPR) repeat protein